MSNEHRNASKVSGFGRVGRGKTVHAVIKGAVGTDVEGMTFRACYGPGEPVIDESLTAQDVTCKKCRKIVGPAEPKTPKVEAPAEPRPEMACPSGYNPGEPHSEQRRVVVSDLLDALRARGWKLGTRTDLEEASRDRIELALRLVAER